MILALVCPCGHFGPLPDESVRLVCSKCQRVHLVEWLRIGASIEALRPAGGSEKDRYRVEQIEPATNPIEGERSEPQVIDNPSAGSPRPPAPAAVRPAFTREARSNENPSRHTPEASA